MKYPTKIDYYKIAFLPLIFLCLISIFGAITYRVYSLNNIGIIISLILAIISFFIIQRFNDTYNKDNYQLPITNCQFKIFYFLLFTSYFLLLTSCFYILFTHRTADAITSPWQVLPPYFFVAYGLATILLISIILKSSQQSLLRPTPYTLILISLHYFLSFSIALIIYKIGYGFDPFIHRATVDLIDKTGSVNPRPFYYLGQYALLVIIHKITALPLNWLDKLLVPLAAAIYFPLILWQVLKKWFEDKKSSLFTMLIILILPFSFFIVTVPQNFAYLPLLLIILLGLKCDNIYDLIIIYILSLASFAFHPIAGIPALIFSFLLTVYHSDKKSIKKYFYILIFALSVIALPLTFYLTEKFLNGGDIPAQKFNWQNLLNYFLSFRIIIPQEENFILNFIYLYGFNLKIIIGAIAGAGLIIAYRQREHCKIFFIYLLMSASLFVSYLLAKILPFSFLISYERDNYSERILLLAAFFLLPFIILTLYFFTNKILKEKKGIKFPLLIFLALLTATSLYFSYPRFDHYFNSHGLSVSQSDIDAVRFIEKNASDDYIVLSNQQVSAAALSEFGFKKYHHQKSEIFYYPLPTSGPLYQYYLDMVYKKPSRTTINAAMDLVGVNEAYFVLNKYWWASPKILEEAKLEANTWREFNNGDIYVFGYNK